MRLASLLLASLVAVPLQAAAEGARLDLTCVTETGETTNILIAPVDTDDRGAGAVTIGPEALAGQAGGFFGPWSWFADGEQYTLMVDGADDGEGVPMLLHVLDTTTDPYTSTLTHYLCEVPA